MSMEFVDRGPCYYCLRMKREKIMLFGGTLLQLRQMFRLNGTYELGRYIYKNNLRLCSRCSRYLETAVYDSLKPHNSVADFMLPEHLK